MTYRSSIANDPIRVLQLLPAFTIGGAELLVVSLASALPSSRFTSHACALFARAENPLRSELDRLGIPVSCLNGSRLYSPSLLRRLIDYVRREKINVIHTHLLSADILGRVVGRLCRVPVVSTLHSIPQGFAKMRADRRWLERASALHLTDQLVTVADYARDQFVADWHMRPEQIMVIRNAISVDRFLLVTEPASENIRSHDPVITTIGRLIPDKAQDVLIDAAKIVLQEHPRAQFVIVGDGSERPKLEAQVAAHGISDRVTFTGMRRDIPELLAQCDIFVLPSRREGLPLSAVEAMAAARPVVVTDVGGNRELITPGIDGLIIPANDVSALAEVLIDLIKQPDLCRKLAQAGRQRAQTHFSLNTMIQQYEAIYERLVTAKRQQLTTVAATDR